MEVGSDGSQDHGRGKRIVSALSQSKLMIQEMAKGYEELANYCQHDSANTHLKRRIPERD